MRSDDSPKKVKPNTANQQPSQLGLIIGVVAIGVEGLLLSPILDDVATAFAMGSTQVGWAVAVYGLSLAVTAPAVGFLGNRVPRKNTMLCGLWLFVCAGLLCAFSLGFWQLLLGRALCGAAAGAFLPACYAFVGDSTAYADRGRAMGRVMAGWSIALIAGIPLSSVIAQVWGWRSSFVVVAALGALAACLVARLGQESVSSSDATLPAGAALLAQMCASTAPKLLAVNFFNMLSFYGVYTYLGLTVRERLGVGSGWAGFFVLCYGLGLLLATLNARLIDRVGKGKVSLWALVLLAGVLLALDSATHHPALLALCMLAWGTLQGLVQTSTATLVSQTAQRARGFTMACLSCTTYLAVAVGSAVGAWTLAGYGFGALTLSATLCGALACLLLWSTLRTPGMES
ncbi:Purine efflux pump PbuE [Delftia tsuruhatensis]|uniref:MFS transporter n=1 Tax=Delftia tsuruhatensis TaxID=180282 RepID=UPI001E774E43|nr:MFS transporter [Delftia tsuruhatensis]CAB5671439.1 Purine efflux pump PbuE [Delftia tsuruhatensis]CAC9683221.1 Purine efflux pump PbuE [Delftia tsuruhatensis]